MTGNILFDPLLPWPIVAAIAVVAVAAVALAQFRGLSGWALRLLGAPH